MKKRILMGVAASALLALVGCDNGASPARDANVSDYTGDFHMLPCAVANADSAEYRALRSDLEREAERRYEQRSDWPIEEGEDFVIDALVKDAVERNPHGEIHIRVAEFADGGEEAQIKTRYYTPRGGHGDLRIGDELRFEDSIETEPGSGLLKAEFDLSHNFLGDQWLIRLHMMPRQDGHLTVYKLVGMALDPETEEVLDRVDAVEAYKTRYRERAGFNESVRPCLLNRDYLEGLLADA